MMKLKNLKFAPIPAVIGLSVATLIAWGINHWIGFPFWGVFAIVIGSMIVNGIIAEIEDDAPGGFNSPTPTKSQAERQP